jgi:hypothetical protein
MADELPERALSVRQPWAWAIIHAGKDIENRSWQAINYGLKRRGPVAIHAAKGMTRREYISTVRFMADIGVTCPPPHELVRGGIIGSVNVIDVVTESDSPWFMGPRGLVLSDPVPCDPIPSRGVLGYFKWENDLNSLADPMKWMLPETIQRAMSAPTAAPLFGDQP